MEVTREVFFEVPADEVWAALTEAERLERWFANEVEIDPVPGGRAVFRWQNGEQREALVEEVEEERALELRWLDDGGNVRLELDELPGGTRLRVTESGPEFAAALGLQAMAGCLVA
ncbi:MAG: SRPBCC family protein [Gaiellaceae bacterium]